MKVPQSSVDYILAHAADRPLCGVARQAKVAVSTMYDILRRHGLAPKRKANEPKLSVRDIVAAEYPTSSSGEIARRHNVSKSLVISWARRLNLSHTPETQARIRRKVSEACAQGRRGAYGKIQAARRRTRRMEELRILSGQKQLTRLRITFVPLRTRKAISRLTCKYNYFTDRDTGGPYTVYYDEHTVRTPLEHLYVRRYRLTFSQA